MRRRDLLKLGAAAIAGLAVDKSAAAEGTKPAPAKPAMPVRNLGKTGFSVGLFSLGGQAALERVDNAANAVPIIDRAIDLGVNYIDTSARYGGSERWSEQYIGQVMKRRRKEVFLATKTHDRTRSGTMKVLERSLELLQTDHIELYQLHNLETMDQLDRIFAKDGAMEALLALREQKVVKYLGVTGHADPDVLIEAIRRYPFDTILLALNAADRYRLPFGEKLLPLAVEKQMGIIGMKIPARGRLLTSWKPPASDSGKPGTMTMKEAMRYALTLPVSTVIVGCDSIAQLEENVTIAREFTPLSSDQMASLETRAEPVYKQSLFFRRWEA
jgi:aryl-alcohol dehydrogenase-like predicted oxidoreductase